MIVATSLKATMLIQTVLVLLLTSIASAAYRQEDEQAYLNNFDASVAYSYSAVDDPSVVPSDLLLQCKDKGLLSDVTLDTEVILEADGFAFLDDNDDSSIIIPTISAASAQAQCNEAPLSVCVVPPSTRLVMSSSLVVNSALIIRGELYWKDQQDEAQWLCAGYIAVEEDGSFLMDVQDSSTSSWIYIMANGATHPIGRERFFGAAAASSSDDSTANPTIMITGRHMVRTWSLLAKPLVTGATTIHMLHSPILMGWRVGDRIGIASMDRSSQGRGQTFSIAAMTDDSVTLDGGGGSNQDLPVSFHPPVKAGINNKDPSSAALRSPEVVNLSRNVVITGDDFTHVPCDASLISEAVPGEQTSTKGCRCSSYRSTCTVGLHTAQMNAGSMQVSNTRVEKCGQRGIEGKYCLHFHKLESCPTCRFSDNAIEYSHQRGIIVHGTHLAKVESNVLWDVRGAGIYIEDGNEMYNEIKYNAVVCPWPFNDQTLQGTL